MFKMRMAFVIGMIFGLAACGGPPPEQLGEASSAIVNGNLDVGDPAVGRAGGCTATLIGRRTALTSAHCGASGYSLELRLYPCGSAVCQMPFTGTFIADPDYSGDGDWDHDIGVIVFNQDISAATGIVPLRIAGTAHEGDRAWLVGYGRTNPDDPNSGGLKHGGYTSIGDTHDQTYDYDDTSQAYGADGDSGGPAIQAYTDCVVGVFGGIDSGFWGLDTDWELTRTDTKLGWIRQWANDPSVYTCNQTVCGDGFCQFGEWCGSCPQDCGACPPPVCGDGSCNGNEDCTSCPHDCGSCPPVCRPGTDDCCNDGVCRSPLLCQKAGC